MYNNLQITYGQPPSSQPQIVAGATSGSEGGGPNIPNGKINKKYRILIILLLLLLRSIRSIWTMSRTNIYIFLLIR